MRVIREILTLAICDASQPFSKGFWRETLAEVLSLWSTIKSYPYCTVPCPASMDLVLLQS